MYNKEQKERFLNDFFYNKETQRMVTYTFEKTAVLEEQFDTDLCNFNQVQLIDLLRYFNCPTENALGKYFNQIKQYAKWCTQNGLCTYNPAYFNIFRKDLKKYINIYAVENQYIKDRTELYNVCEDIYNAVDRAIIVLLYEGVGGEKLTELRELKKTDVKIITKEINITNGEYPRPLSNVDDRTMDILEEAINTYEYYTNNGESVAKAPKRYMIESDYVIRPTKMHNMDGSPISSMGIDVKFSKIKKWTGKYYLTATNIIYSGIFEKLAKIEENKELDTMDYRETLIKSGINPESYGMLKERYETYKKYK